MAAGNSPPAFQQVFKVLPSTWAVLGFQDIIAHGQSFHGILLEAGVLLGFAGMFFLIGVWRFDFE